jgi:hypothetical protein
MEFKETMFTGDAEARPQSQEENPIDLEILELNTHITKTQDFIKSLEEMQKISPTDQRQKDIVTAKIDLAEQQTKKQELLDEKFKKIPRGDSAANDSQIMSDADQESWKRAA